MGRVGRRVSFRRSGDTLGVLNRLVLNRHVGRLRPGFPESHESLAGQHRSDTDIYASHPQRSSRRQGAASK
jgi:hypothetical protein